MAAPVTTEARKTLPGIDTAPDTYETTPSSAPSTIYSDSDTSHSGEEEGDGEEVEVGVSRRRLYPAGARERFGVGESGGRRRRTGRKGREDGDEEEETLEVRIARLRREVEECRVLASQQQTDGEEEGEEGDAAESLSRILSSLPTTTTKSRPRNSSATYHDAPTIPSSSIRPSEAEDEANLAKISAFETRLAALESTLGAAEETSTTAAPPPLLPTLAHLDHQFAILSSATSLSALEAAGAKLSSLQTEPARSPTNEPASSPSSELQSLYTLLPTLQHTHSIIPPLLTRLRSLRALHTAAASAHEDLRAVEEGQEAMEKELKMWREGLERVEGAVREAVESNGRNGEVVRGWVEDLGQRVGGLRR